MRIKNQPSWNIVYVEPKGDVWFFETNIDIKKKSEVKLRKKIRMKALKLKGII